MNEHADGSQPDNVVATALEAKTSHVMSPERDDYLSLAYWYRKLGNHLRYGKAEDQVGSAPGVDVWTATGNPTAVNILDRARNLLLFTNPMATEEKAAALTALGKEADALIASTPPIENSHLSTRE